MVPVSGGCIHQAFRVDARAGSVFVKWNDARAAASFEAEAQGLDALREAPGLRVPRVLARGADGNDAWLVLEWIDLRPLSDHGSRRLGHALAGVHRIRGPRFGWPTDNWLGTTRQCNRWHDAWPAFWRDCRLLPQVHLAVERGARGAVIDDGLRLAEHVPSLLAGHMPHASLLHGDLWAGNAAETDSGEPVLFDPAVYFGDAEADIAMTHLFGGFDQSFHRAWRDSAPTREEHLRRDLYNLYHVLNHWNLFGGAYERHAHALIHRLLATVR